MAAAAVSIGPVFAFASALVGVGPALQGLYAANTIVTAVIITTINSLQAQNEATYTFLANLYQAPWVDNANFAITAEYNNIYNTAVEFIDLANNGFLPQAQTDALRTKILSSNADGMQYAIDRITNFSIMTSQAAVRQFLRNCQVLPTVPNCQTSAAVYGINLMVNELMAYSLLIWAKGPTTNIQTRLVLDSMFPNINQQLLRIEQQLKSYYVYGPSPWTQYVLKEPLFVSLGGNLYNIDFFFNQGPNTASLVVSGAQINRQANPTAFWGSQFDHQFYYVPVMPSIFVRPSVVSLGNLLHLLYLGSDNNVYYFAYSAAGGTWTPRLSLAVTTLFPDFNAADGGFSRSIFQFTTAGGNLYLIGVSPTEGVKVYKMAGSTPPELVGTGLGDASWGHPQYYLTFQALDLDGTLYVFGRAAAGMLVCRLNPTSTTMMQITTVSEFSNIQGWGNDISAYSTIKVLYVNGDLVFFGRKSSGVVINLYEKFLANPLSAPLVSTLPTWSDASGFGSAYETIKAYTVNTVGLVSAFVNKMWQTCVIRYPFAVFDCTSNNINTPPTEVDSLGPYFGVVNYDWQKGSIPMFYYSIPKPLPSGDYYQIVMLPGNPFQISFNFNSSRVVNTPGLNLQ